jgi:parallel beta-helix repeat protein
MPITHSTIAASGGRGFAVDWNAEHVVTDEYESKRTATRIVAANDSLDTTKADYVCDGSSDEVQINQAITDLAGLGGRVILLEGTFDIGSSILLDDDVTLEGQGFGTVVTTDDNIRMIYSNAKLWVIVRNLHIVGAGAAHGNNAGIYFEDGSDNLIFNCLIESCGTNGIVFDGDDNSWAIKNILRDQELHGIYLLYADYATIKENRLWENDSEGIFAMASDRCLIEANIVYNSGLAGIKLDTGCVDSVVSGNIVIDNGTEGIYLTGDVDNTIVANNRCTGNTIDQILIADATCDKNLIHGNHCLTGVGAAITDNGTNTTLADNVVA